jgi:hypothetical protein
MPTQQNKGIEEMTVRCEECGQAVLEEIHVCKKSTPTANWEVKYNSILQVLESRNDTTSKYKVIEALIDGIFCEELEGIKREIEELPTYMRVAEPDVDQSEDSILKNGVISLIDKRLNNNEK